VVTWTPSPVDKPFHCTACGGQDHADLNAAFNILASGIGATAQGEAFSVETSVICEIRER